MPMAPVRPGRPLPAPPRVNQAVRRWYFTIAWQRLRQDVLTTANYTCAVCGHVVLELDVDHIDPHRGEADRFWDVKNLQALCKACHAIKTRRGE